MNKKGIIEEIFKKMEEIRSLRQEIEIMSMQLGEEFWVKIFPSLTKFWEIENKIEKIFAIELKKEEENEY